MFFPTLSITLNEQLCEDKHSDFFCTVEEKEIGFEFILVSCLQLLLHLGAALCFSHLHIVPYF